jgi:hypothetical protein
MRPVVPVLNTVFWVAAPLFVVSLFLSDSTPGLIGDKGLRVVNAALLVVKCSGALASCELARNPIADTELGQWTNRQLFYAIVFTISFFLAVFSSVWRRSELDRFADVSSSYCPPGDQRSALTRNKGPTS